VCFWHGAHRNGGPIETAGTLFRAAADMISARCTAVNVSGMTTRPLRLAPKGDDGGFDFPVAVNGHNDRHDLE
jgi:hypothetical protein